jgi:molybdate transport system substrate-binding protein
MTTRRSWLALLVAAGLASTAGALPAVAQGKDVVIFAAASLKNALDDIAGQWQRETGKKVVVSYAASNTLIKQIEQSAPADIFISADLDWMDYGQQKDLIKPDSRSNLLGNRLVLIAPKDSSVSANIQPGFDLAALLKGGRLAYGQCRCGAGGQIWQSLARETRRLGQRQGQDCAGGNRPRGPAVCVTRRSPARHRLPN